MIRLTSLIAAVLVLASSNVSAREYTEGTWSGALRASTGGFGVEATYPFSKYLSVRAIAVGGLSATRSEEAGDIPFEADSDLGSGGLVIEVHPFGNGFSLNVGGLFNKNEIDATSDSCRTAVTGTDTYRIGSRLYQGDFCITGKGEFDRFAPMVSIGWSPSFYKRTPWFLALEAGVIFQGEPDVVLNSTGTATYNDSTGNGVAVDTATDPEFRAGLDAKEDELEDELEDLDLFPIVSLSVGYRFSF